MADVEKENLEAAFNNGKQIAKRVRYLENDGQPSVIKQMKNDKDFEGHIKYYDEIVAREIRTPQLLSIDRTRKKIKYKAVGIEKNGNGFWSKTLVNFKYEPEKENDNLDFLIRVIDYAIAKQWTDLHSGNILFDNGLLYLIDYIPARGKHPIGSFGLGKVSPDEKNHLIGQGFDNLLEKALAQCDDTSVSYSGLEALRRKS